MYFCSDIHVVMKKSYQAVKPKPKTTANNISNKYKFTSYICVMTNFPRSETSCKKCSPKTYLVNC